MRKLAPALVLLAAACTTAPPTPVATPSATTPGHRHGHLIGLSAADLGDLFGVPALQVREGPGIKLQWRGGGCVLDAYLYPPYRDRASSA